MCQYEFSDSFFLLRDECSSVQLYNHLYDVRMWRFRVQLFYNGTGKKANEKPSHTSTHLFNTRTELSSDLRACTQTEAVADAEAFASTIVVFTDVVDCCCVLPLSFTSPRLYSEVSSSSHHPGICHPLCTNKHTEEHPLLDVRKRQPYRTECLDKFAEPENVFMFGQLRYRCG